MTEITSLSVTELTSGLAAKSFSSVEITSACIARVKKLSTLNAFISVAEETALAQAKKADELLSRGGAPSPLLGIPVAVKDVIITEGIETTCGSKILKGFVPPYDSTAVAKLKRAGALVIGKTNMDEFAMGSSNENSAFGPVKNPWDVTRVPGGSSGGSAVAVAAHMAPLSLGTDTGGSIRQPASLCSIVGLKPTYGRVSRYGAVAFASSLDQIGPFARNVSDCAIISEALFGHDPKDSTSVNVPVPLFSKDLKNEIKGLKIGIPKEYFIGGLSPDVDKAVKAAISHLEKLGAIPVEISLPHTESAVSAYYILAPAEASSNLARFDGIRYGHRASDVNELQDIYCKTRTEGFGTEVKRRIMIGSYVLSSGYFDAYYLRAQKVRTLIAQDFKNAFANSCDLIVCPTAPTTAFKIGEKTSDPVAMYLNDVFTIPVNLAGLPGMSVPCGFDGAGLPIGLQIIGKPWDEAKIFNLAYTYEQTTDWHKRSPNI